MPSALVGYGFSQFIVPQVKDLNLKIKSEISGNISHAFRIDDYSQYVPALSVYALNMLGINGKHNFLDRSIILGTSMAVMGVTVSGIKYLSHLQRPDGSAFNSFPSGHTATAFTCAEFLYQEYKDVSIWYGIAGYTIAAGTGFMRIYNNRHWLTDVVAGAGFGIISTKVGYWVFPKLKKLFFKDIRISVSFMPSFVPQYGLIQ
jgi:membrane-associated phospholipid phosphatase